MKWIVGIIMVFVLSYLSWRIYNIVPVDHKFTVATLGGAITLGSVMLFLEIGNKKTK